MNFNLTQSGELMHYGASGAPTSMSSGGTIFAGSGGAANNPNAIAMGGNKLAELAAGAAAAEGETEYDRLT